MSIEAMTWALSVPVGGSQKVMLLGLANHAHPDGSEAYPSLDTLAEYGHCDRSTARRSVRKLAEAGWIVLVGTGPRGTDKYVLQMGVAKCHVAERDGVAPAPQGGGTGASEGVAPMPPEPPMNRTEPVVEDAGASKPVPTGVPTDVVGALIAAGFDDLTIEQHTPTVAAVLVEFQPPDDTDWFRVGTLLRQWLEQGRIKHRTPPSALRFLFKSADGVPRINQPGRPLFVDKPLTAHQKLNERRFAAIRGEA